MYFHFLCVLVRILELSVKKGIHNTRTLSLVIQRVSIKKTLPKSTLPLGEGGGVEIHHFIQTEFLLMLKSTSTKMLIKPFLHPQRNHLRGSHWGTKVGRNNLIGGWPCPYNLPQTHCNIYWEIFHLVDMQNSSIPHWPTIQGMTWCNLHHWVISSMIVHHKHNEWSIGLNILMPISNIMHYTHNGWSMSSNIFVPLCNIPTCDWLLQVFCLWWIPHLSLRWFQRRLVPSFYKWVGCPTMVEDYLKPLFFSNLKSSHFDHPTWWRLKD